MSFVAPRDEASTLAFAGTAMPENFRLARQVALAIATVAVVIFVVAVRVLWRAVERANQGASVAARQTLRNLFWLMVVYLLLNATDFALHAFPLSWQACAVLGVLPADLYVLSRFFSCRVLIARAEAVGMVMPGWYHFVLAQMRIGSHCVWPMLVLASISCSGSLLFEPGVCTQQLNGMLIFVGGFLDGSVSVIMLILFIKPILRERGRYWHRTHSKTDETTTTPQSDVVAEQRLRKAALNGFVFSAIPIVTTFIFLCMHAPTNDEAALEKLENQHYRLFTFYGSSLDSLINAASLVMLYRKLVFGRTKRRVWSRPLRTLKETSEEIISSSKVTSMPAT